MEYYRDLAGRLWRGPYLASYGPYWSRLERYGVWRALACDRGADWTPAGEIAETWYPQWGVEIEPKKPARK